MKAVITEPMGCRLKEQGFEPGSCLVEVGGRLEPACRATYMVKGGVPYRLIYSYAHKAPECYLSIYQSGCNFSCRKCHSWRFTKHAVGEWMSPMDVAAVAALYAELHGEKLYREPRERATSWHATSLCRACGSCLVTGARSPLCPGALPPDMIVALDDGSFGPARNIVSFTGGDLACCVEFYVEATRLIKERAPSLWVMFETNGYGLTPQHLDALRDAGLDSIWLDIKALDEEVHRYLTGCSNKWILQLPGEILERGFVLEVSTVYIPGLVEEDQVRGIAELLAQVDRDIPYAIIAFIPEHQLRHLRPPTLEEMLKAYYAARDAGLRRVKLGNPGLFARTMEELEELAKLGAI